MAPHVARWIERLLAAHEPPLTVAQLLALEAAEEGIVGAQLAERAAVSPAAVSQLLTGLEDAGLVARVRASDDRRRQRLVLTVAGRRTLRSVRETLARGLLPLVSVLRRTEAESLAAALAVLAPAVGATPPPRRPPRPSHPPRTPRRR
ncbi:MAG TPA: MarR family transcriptional regulator [Gaiellaceae bacterium]|nr:MarR family transcriptional regulator [Gaiellaceae bacterium]